MTKSKELKKKPPIKPVKTLQLELFSDFITNDTNTVSNTVELWERIPKYFFTPHQVEKLRTKDGFANSYKWEYIYNGISCMVKIQPALIEQIDGSEKAFFPSITEELVEEVLKKILTEQNFGSHSQENNETWVYFTLSMIAKELKNRGRKRNLPQIKHAIDVMSGCIITIYRDGQEVWKGPILDNLITVNREKYVSDTSAKHVARLPLFITQAINSLDYRQFNYDRLMSCSDQLTRWIYKKLIHRYKQANYMNDYHFNFSSVERESGFLQQGRAADNRKKILRALEELKKRDVISEYKKDEKKEGRKIFDVTYTVKPSFEFVKEQKAANKRAANNRERIKKIK